LALSRNAVATDEIVDEPGADGAISEQAIIRQKLFEAFESGFLAAAFFLQHFIGQTLFPTSAALSGAPPNAPTAIIKTKNKVFTRFDIRL
jgi:hypothetical protein